MKVGYPPIPTPLFGRRIGLFRLFPLSRLALFFLERQALRSLKPKRRERVHYSSL